MNTFNWKSYNYFNPIAYGFFILFALFSLMHAQARILISDPAFYLFNMINSSGFYVPGTRETAVINQFLVVLGIRMNFPLQVLIGLYSFSFVLVRFLYFYVANNILKNKEAGFAIIVISIAGVAHSYFRPTSESTIAMLNSLLLYAWLGATTDWKMSKYWKIAIQVIGTLSLIYFGYLTHPVALFSLLFVIIYDAIAHGKLKTIYPYIAVLFTLGLFMHEVFLGSDNAHHESLYGNILNSPLQILQEIRDYYPYKFFDSRFKMLYRPLGLLFIGAIVLLLVRKRWLGGTFLLLYALFYFVITCTSFKDGDSDMQMEKVFLPLILFSAIAFSESLSRFKFNHAVLLAVLVVALSLNGYNKIKQVEGTYTNRIDYLKEIIKEADKQDSRKLVLDRTNLNNPRMVFSWAMGIETLMLSSMDIRMTPLTVFCAPKASDVSERMKQPDNMMVAPFATSFTYNSFNDTYFALPKEEYKLWEKDFK